MRTGYPSYLGFNPNMEHQRSARVHERRVCHLGVRARQERQGREIQNRVFRARGAQEKRTAF